MAIRHSDHTDSVERKLQLLKTAYGEGNLDVAMSLAESIKDTLRFERQSQSEARDDGALQIGAEAFVPVSRLPPGLAKWARGWSYCKPLTLFETVGIARSSDPVELAVSVPLDHVTDVAREVRVARFDTAQKRYREVPSQVFGETRHGRNLNCRIVFFAEVGPHASADYLIFYGNPHAELPQYPSDLRIEGEGYGLDVANRHYLARLSRQTGQLERLTLAREHGLELYAGGKGHGEPPCIDWGHDYVDQGQFQKLRMRNAPHWPNYEVTRGPLVARLRRWGFPYSPVHPIFTPSRMHMDITYTFYAELPYFVKQGRMDMVQDFSIEATRDDEWVFSGYSFTDMVWIDSAGRVHEGEVPRGQSDVLWGVGFFNRVSRDAFVALRLAHTSRGFPGLQHGGAPTLHYAGHGQLWSRYPAGHAQMKAGASIHQKNAYLVAPYPTRDAAAEIQQVRHRLIHSLEVRAEMPARLEDAALVGRPLARPGETPETATLKTSVWKALREVKDEQFYSVDANIVDMGYVYDVRERDGIVRVVLTMPHRGRPVYEFLVSQGGGRVDPGVRERVLKLPGVRDVVVEFTWNPPWTAARLTDKGREAMGLSV